MNTFRKSNKKLVYSERRQVKIFRISKSPIGHSKTMKEWWESVLRNGGAIGDSVLRLTGVNFRSAKVHKLKLSQKILQKKR